MQAIQTKVIPATNYKPTRIKAKCERGSLTVSADSVSGDECNNTEIAHARAARLLCNKFVAEDNALYGEHKNPWDRPFVTGGLPDGTVAHVFLDSDKFFAPGM